MYVSAYSKNENWQNVRRQFALFAKGTKFVFECQQYKGFWSAEIF